MAEVLLDTHTWAWTLTDNPRLSASAREAIESAAGVLVSPVSFFEIGNKVRLGKWTEMSASLVDLAALLTERGGRIADFTPDIALLAAALDWPHRDPFDRMIAASAMRLGAPLVSTDTVFDGLAGHPNWPGRVW